MLGFSKLGDITVAGKYLEAENFAMCVISEVKPFARKHKRFYVKSRACRQVKEAGWCPSSKEAQ